MKWWQSLDDGDLVQVLLLQVDLTGHGTWMRTEPQTGIACHDRAAFARGLDFRLSSEGFGLLFWAGDGGVFAKRLERGQPRAVVQAIDCVFREFRPFQTEHPRLGIRVTATYLPDVVVYQEAGYWCSTDLNEFLKYERHFAIRGGAVITEALYKKLYDNADRNRLTIPRRVIVDGQQHTTYVDSEHTGTFHAPRVGFQQWLEMRLKAAGLPRGRKNERGYIEVGQCTVLDGARHPDGIVEILGTSRDPVAEESVEQVILPQHRAQWKNLVREYEKDEVKGWSSSVFGYRGDLSEDPFRFFYKPIKYVHGRAFHALLEADSSAPELYREIAFGVAEDKATLPNILSVGVAAVIGEGNESLLVIAQRSIQRPGGYHGGKWSPTIGEQFSPFDHTRGSRARSYCEVPRDDSIRDCAARALEEELIGKEFNGSVELCIAAFAMENFLDNFVFCVVADLRPLSFAQLVDAWSQARDKNEHKTIAVLNRDEVELCMGSEAIPDDCWKRMLEGNQIYPAIDLLPSERLFQLNAHVRLASWLWFTDQISR